MTGIVDSERVRKARDRAERLEARAFSLGIALHAAAKTGEAGMTPLHLAAATGDPASITALVEAGADRTALDDEGRAPIKVLPPSVSEAVRDICRPGAGR